MFGNKARKTVEWTRFDEADPMFRHGGGSELREVIRSGEVTSPMAVAPFSQSINFRATYYPFPIRAGFETGGGGDFVVADFNGDGRLDILMTYHFHPIEDRAVPVRLFTQQADGQFIDTTNIAFPNGVPAAVHPRQIVSGDFNGDGRTDAFIADHGLDGPPFPGAPNQLVLSTGATGLQSVQGAWSTITDFTHSAAVGDIDGDGDLDLFAGNQDDEADATPYFLINGGLGNFTLSRSGLVDLTGPDPGFTTSLLFDADSDGDLDLFLGPWDPRLRAATIYENDGTGKFLTVLSTLDVPAHGSSENVIDSHALDLNGDGHLDLVINTVVDFNQLGSIRFYINDGAGNFTDETEIRLPSRLAQPWHTRVDFADFDGDGFADMLVSSGATNPLFINDGSGVFHQLIGASPAPSIENDGPLQFADANADGLMDIVAWRGQYGGAENLAIYFQQAVPASQTGTAEADGLLGDADADTLAGAGGDDRLFGSRGNDVLDGGAGNDILIGGPGDDTLNGGEGDDLFKGGQGNDVYIVDQAGDIVVDRAGEGVDEIRTGLASFSLSGLANTENLSGGDVAQTLTGNGLGNILRGEGGNDTLFGLGGNDFLVGGGGSDTMVGGLGDDTYYVDSTSDALSEYAGEGNERIATVITLALAADADIERIDVENLASTNAIDLTGSGIANVIYGNDGVNILRGEAGNDELRGFGGSDYLVGGAGTDLMVGGIGDDTFYVDDASDAIGEIAGEGNDRIAASVSFVLSNGANVEVLEAVNVAATTAFDLTGSDSANTITGNAGVNLLKGEGGNDILSGAGGDDFLVGGSGNDTMNGGTGNDTYYVDAAGDVVNEYTGEGTNDRVATSVSYTLAALADIERLEAADSVGTAAMDLTGSNTGNSITGNNGANVLDGKGGSDTLTGLGGNDTFQFTTALVLGNVDIVVGFVTGGDRIALDDAVFTQAGATGALNANAFFAGTAAHDADDRIIYNAATGALLYDADGTGAAAAVQFATLNGSPALAASDFVVI